MPELLMCVLTSVFVCMCGVATGKEGGRIRRGYSVCRILIRVACFVENIGVQPS